MRASERGAAALEPAGAYLAEASRVLSDSLDYETTLGRVAELALPQLGGWCIVDLLEEDGTMRRVAVVHPDPARQPMARRLVSGWPPHRDDPLGLPVVMRTRRAELIPDVSEDMLTTAAHDSEHRRVLQALGMGAVIVAPMLARGSVLGAITFVSGPGQHYGDEDLAVAEDLARRAGISIDNARLFRAAERARAQAEEASRAKSEFLAAMSHEMRTPLNAVLGYVDLLEVEIAGPLTEEQREQMARIRGSSAQLLALVDQVLDLARLESGSLPVARERAPVREAVDEALGRIRTAAAAEGVALANECPGDSRGYFVGDVGRVGEVLDHLLSNAVKFTGRGGQVRVTCGVAGRADPGARVSGPGPWACIEVEDTGVGIEPGRLDEMFEPFRQGSAGHTRTEGGAGLGLTVARHLSRLMGGDVTVRSSPGRGSCFTLWLPAAPESEVDLERDERARRRSGHAIEAAGRDLTCHVDGVMEAYVRRIRGDARLRSARDATTVDLLDHAATLVADVAQSMVVLGGVAEDTPRLLRDGSRIQRFVAELHAEQRRRLGWTEPELRRDFEVLREEVESSVRTHCPPGEGAEAAAAVAARLLRQSERVGMQAYRAAAASDEPTSPPPEARSGAPSAERQGDVGRPG
ncbi:GAF domain-containing sensor histidine kinase [Longimicrobium sp.]|uniref:GAF domain-containing sensor histidine kinase n=1 Tax=Longimicrobium sp. TaxID=2029185 RepID=UPI002C8C1B74|nr:ATP-binding protein [Longimicrobium sp.]HSU14699.1 ATP-binding protein [Longimicrobium sp.]